MIKSSHFRRWPEVHAFLSKKRLYPIEKSFIQALYLKGYKIHTIARALNLSSKTVWNTVKKHPDFMWARVFWRKVKNTSANILSVQNKAKCFKAWFSYFQLTGIMDMDAVLRGERPP